MLELMCCSIYMAILGFMCVWHMVFFCQAGKDILCVFAAALLLGLGFMLQIATVCRNFGCQVLLRTGWSGVSWAAACLMLHAPCWVAHHSKCSLAACMVPAPNRFTTAAHQQ
jgi:hypothetical protein